jgi:hypothetical protein
MTPDELRRKRKIAKKRIVEQFPDHLKRYSVVVVDCGEVGTAVVTCDDYGEIHWVEPNQMVKLQGRID